MWHAQDKSAMRLAGWAAFGFGLYLVSVAVLLTIGRQYFDSGGYVVRFGWLLAALGPGSAIALRAVSRLKDGMRRERWSEERVGELRRVMDSNVWTLLSWSLLALMVVPLIFLRHTAAPGALLLLPIHVVSALKAAVRKPVADESRWMDKTVAIPLQSEHWGVQSSNNGRL